MFRVLSIIIFSSVTAIIQRVLKDRRLIIFDWVQVDIAMLCAIELVASERLHAIRRQN